MTQYYDRYSSYRHAKAFTDPSSTTSQPFSSTEIDKESSSYGPLRKVSHLMRQKNIQSDAVVNNNLPNNPADHQPSPEEIHKSLKRSSRRLFPTTSTPSESLEELKNLILRQQQSLASRNSDTVNSTHLPRKVSEQLKPPTYLGFSMAGDPQRSLGSASSRTTPATTNRSNNTSRKRPHPRRHTAAATATNLQHGDDKMDFNERPPIPGSSTEFIHTDDWRRGQELIRQELGPPPPGMKKKKEKILQEADNRLKKSTDSGLSTAWSKKPMTRQSSAAAGGPPPPPPPAHHPASVASGDNSKKSRHYDSDEIRRYIKQKKSARHNGKQQQQQQAETVPHKTNKKKREVLYKELEQLRELCRKQQQESSAIKKQKQQTMPASLTKYQQDELSIVNEESGELDDNFKTLPVVSSGRQKKEEAVDEMEVEDNNLLDSEESTLSAGSDREFSLGNNDDDEDDIEDEEDDNDNLIQRKIAIQSSAMDLIQRLSQFTSTLRNQPMSLGGEKESDDDDDDTEEDSSIRAVAYGSERAPVTRYQRIVPTKPVIFRDDDDLPGARPVMRSSTSPSVDDNSDDDDDDDEDVGNRHVRWAPIYFQERVPVLKNPLFPQSQSQRWASQQEMPKPSLSDFTQRLPNSRDPFSFHSTYRRQKKKEIKNKRHAQNTQKQPSKRSQQAGQINEEYEDDFTTTMSSAKPTSSQTNLRASVSTDESKSQLIKSRDVNSKTSQVKPKRSKSPEASKSSRPSSSTRDAVNGQTSKTIESNSSTLRSSHSQNHSNTDRPATLGGSTSSLPTHQTQHKQTKNKRGDERSGGGGGGVTSSYSEMESLSMRQTTLNDDDASGRLSPAALKRRFLAELHYYDSIAMTLDQLGETERMRALSMAHQETVSLAQIIQNQQLNKRRELEAALLEAQRTHQVNHGRDLEEIRQRTMEAANQFTQMFNQVPPTTQLHSTPVSKAPRASQPTDRSIAKGSTELYSSSSSSLPTKSIEKRQASSSTISQSQISSHETNTGSGGGGADGGDGDIHTEMEMSETTLEQPNSIASSIESSIHNTATITQTSEIHEEIGIVSDEERSSFLEILPSESHRRRQKGKQHQQRLTAAAKTKAAPPQTPATVNQSRKKKKSSLVSEEEDFDSLTESLVERLRTDKEAKKRHEEVLNKIRSSSKEKPRPQDKAWESRNAIKRPNSDEKYPTQKPKSSEEREPITNTTTTTTSPAGAADNSITENLFKKMSKRMGLNEKLLTKRERELHQRRIQAEKLLKWKLKLDKEEKRIQQLEKECLQNLKRDTNNKAAEASAIGKAEVSVKQQQQSDSSSSKNDSESSTSLLSTETRSSTSVKSVTEEMDASSAIRSVATEISVTPRPVSTRSSVPEELSTNRGTDYEKSVTYSKDNFDSSDKTSSSASTTHTTGTTQKRKSSAEESSLAERTIDESILSETVSDVSEMQKHILTLREELQRKKREFVEEKRRIKSNLKHEKDILSKRIDSYNQRLATLQHNKNKKELKIPLDEEKQRASSRTSNRSEPPSAAVVSNKSITVEYSSDEESTITEDVSEKLSFSHPPTTATVEQNDDSSVASGTTKSVSLKADEEGESFSEEISKKESSLRKVSSGMSSVASEVVEDLEEIDEAALTPRTPRKLTFSEINEEYSASDHEDSMSKKIQQVASKSLPLSEDSQKSSSSKSSKSSTSKEKEKPSLPKEVEKIDLHLADKDAGDQDLDQSDSEVPGAPPLSARTINSELPDIPEDLDFTEPMEDLQFSDEDNNENSLVQDKSMPSEAKKSQASIDPLYSEDFSSIVEDLHQNLVSSNNKPSVKVEEQKQVETDDVPSEKAITISEEPETAPSYVPSDKSSDHSATSTTSSKPSSVSVSKSSVASVASKSSSHEPVESKSSTSAAADLPPASKSPDKPKVNRAEDISTDFFTKVLEESINDMLTVKRKSMTSTPPAEASLSSSSSSLDENSSTTPVVEKSTTIPSSGPSLLSLKPHLSSPSNESIVNRPLSSPASSYLESFLSQRQRTRAIQFVIDNRSYCETLQVLKEDVVNSMMKEAIAFLWSQCTWPNSSKTPQLSTNFTAIIPSQFIQQTDSEETDEKMADRLFPQGLNSSGTISRRLIFDLVLEKFAHVYQLKLNESEMMTPSTTTTTTTTNSTNVVESSGHANILKYFYPTSYPAKERQMYRLWRGTIPPQSLDKLENIILSEVSNILWQPKGGLDNRLAPQLSRVVQWTLNNKRDAIDKHLVEDLRRDEATWVTYDEDEMRVKLGLTDSIFDWLIGDLVDELMQM